MQQQINMKRKNEDTLLLPVSRHDFSTDSIREIMDISKGKNFDIIYFAGTDRPGQDYFPLEELMWLAAEIPEIRKIIRCDVSKLAEYCHDDVDQKQLLGNWQFRYILRTSVLAYLISTEDYDQVIYYGLHADHRLTEIPARTFLKEPECICLTKQISSDSPADLYARRFLASQAVSLRDNKPEYGYTMKEKNIRKFSRSISDLLKTIQPETTEYRL